MESAEELSERLAKIEAAIAAMQRSLDTLLAERTQSSASETREARARDPMRDPFPEDVLHQRKLGFAEHRSFSSRRNVADELGDNLTNWFSSRNPEWWLSRLGIGFVVLAVLLLYGYAIDKGWITPPVRVLAGAALGGVLFWLATRTVAPTESREAPDLGLRELFFGGALAVWYVTAYAAAVWYQLISIPTARLG